MGKSDSFQTKKSQDDKFRLAAKNIFLTYPRCDCPKQDALDLLRKLHFGYFSKYAICQEHHKDAARSLHLHMLLMYDKKINVTNPQAFDIVDGNGKVYHPSIGSVRSLKDCFNYMHKEDKTPLTNIESSDIKCAFEAFWEEPDPDKALANIRKSEPKQSLVLTFQIDKEISAKRRRLNDRPFQSRYSIDSYDVPLLVDAWRLQIKSDLPRCKLLILIGPSKLGKTEMIRSFGPHIFQRSTWSLSDLRDNLHSADYIVFDDVDWNRTLVKLLRPIFLAMGDCILSDKYTKKVPISTVGKPCAIISHNPYDVQWFMGPEWDDNKIVCYVDKPTYRVAYQAESSIDEL